jgi:uncharacterized protein (TIGR02217 family)
MTFYAVELDICPAYGWQGGPLARTRIRSLRNGHERRNVEADVMRHRFTLPFQNITNMDYLAELKNAHAAMYGMAHSFLVKDWTDFTATNESLGLAPSGSTPVQLVRNYPFGPVNRTRNITKPVAGAVIRQNGVVKAGTLNTLTGLFTPTTSWTPGATLTWTGEFLVPVRFDNDFLAFSLDGRSKGEAFVNGSIELIEDLDA